MKIRNGIEVGLENVLGPGIEMEIDADVLVRFCYKKPIWRIERGDQMIDFRRGFVKIDQRFSGKPDFNTSWQGHGLTDGHSLELVHLSRGQHAAGLEELLQSDQIAGFVEGFQANWLNGFDVRVNVDQRDHEKEAV